MSDDPSAREEGFYWVELGQTRRRSPTGERGEWWLAGDASRGSPTRSTCSATSWCSARG
jgi:hypothetical protein